MRRRKLLRIAALIRCSSFCRDVTCNVPTEEKWLRFINPRSLALMGAKGLARK
jgi:hypothetical protein